MLKTYTAQQIRRAETAALARVADGVLMQRASWAVASAVIERMPTPIPGRSAVLLVGPGNNGGDALFAGAVLRRHGMRVTAVVTDPDRVHPAGMTTLRRRGCAVMGADAPEMAGELRRADAIVDGLVGIGARPPLREPMGRLVAAASASPAWRVAVDVPSGVDPDTGRVDGAVFDADITVTMGGLKTGLLLADAAGEVRLPTIGMGPDAVGEPIDHDAAVITDDDVPALLSQPGRGDNKYSLGVTGVVAGSARYPGAALLATGGAVKSRPGLVRYIGARADAVVQRFPEVVVAADVADAGRVQAWVVGPGGGTDGAALATLRQVLEANVPVLIDADGLTLAAQTPSLLARRARRGAVTVLTPHAGEFARIFPDLDPADRLASVRAAAARSGAIVLLKGHRTVIADPAGRVFINTSAPPWLATAGSGDVLAGIAGSLLAASTASASNSATADHPGADPLTAVALAAYLHGRAGQRAAAARQAGASALLDHVR